MASKIYELYKENREAPLDEKFINNAFEIMLDDDKGLIPYIEDFRITKLPRNLIGAYSNEERCIKINKEAIEEQSINQQLFALHVLRHELEHARNLKTLYEGRKDIESLVVYYSLRSYAMEHGLDYSPNVDNLFKSFLDISIKMNYEVDPGERLADIKASKYIVNLLKNQRRTEDLLIARGMLYYAYARGYNDNGYYLDPPTYDFLLKTGMYRDHYWLKNRVNAKDYCFDTRITYGLRVTYTEYKRGISEKTKVLRKEDLNL